MRVIGGVMESQHTARRPTLDRRRLLMLAGSAPLAGCAAVPDVDDYLAMGHEAALRRSLLGSAAARVGRSSPAPPPDEAEVSAALQRQYEVQLALSESPMKFGNQATVLPTAADAFAAIFKAMHAARDHINLEYFVLADVRCNNESLGDVLRERLGAGVAVNVIYDSYGSKETPREFFDSLRTAGARVVEFNPLEPLAARTGWSPNDRDHRKIMVVDGSIGFTGGVNLDRAYENPPSAGLPANGDTDNAFWRDTAVRLEGPAVAELQKLFFLSWQNQKGPPTAPAHYFPPLPRRGVQTVRIIGSVPGEQRPLYFISLITAIRSARWRIWASSGYFLPPHQEREALSAAAAAGVDVRLVTPSHSDVQSAVYAARAAYGDLLESGARIWEVQNAVLHSKLVTVDGIWSVIGSSNLDRRSVVFNNEVDAIILGRDTAGQVETILRRDIAASREVTQAAWSHRSINERMHEVAARVWQYWM